MSIQEQEPKWWIIVLKAIVYIIGLVLAGYGTGAAAQAMNIF